MQYLPVSAGGRMRLNSLSALATTTILAALLAGCASMRPASNGGSTSASVTSLSPAAKHEKSHAHSGNAGNAKNHPSVQWPPAANTSAQPYQWPSASQDIWAEIRAGFRLPGNRWRRRVRHWAQFYATHTGHLDASLKRARPWLYHVVKQVKKRHMPTEIALLPIVESGYNARATSASGASGLWQLMPSTARGMTLTRNWWYHGRNDPIASTQAALDYLERLHTRYNGSWLLALAAYNAGPGTIDHALAQAKRQGKPANYWHLDVSKETSNYVPKLLALRWVMSAPDKFGIHWPKLANKPRTQIVKLPKQMGLSIAANMVNMSTQQLVKLNPEIQHQRSRPKNGHLIVPSGKASLLRTKLASANPAQLVKNHSGEYRVHRGDSLSSIAQRFGVSVTAIRHANGMTNNRIRAGQKLRIPHRNRKGASHIASTKYTVQPGDSLWKIAHNHQTSVAAIKRVNDNINKTLHPGQTISVPSAGMGHSSQPAQVVVHHGETLWSIAHRNHVSVADLRKWNRLKPNATIQPGQTLAVGGSAGVPDYYRVKSGDSLWSIANRFSMNVSTLKRLNNIGNSHAIQPGQRLRLQPSVSS